MNFMQAPYSIASFFSVRLTMFFAWITWSALMAQPNPLSFHHYTQKDGLSAPVKNITQDLYGFLWLGTTDGLNRFDGITFGVFRHIPGDTQSLPSNIINSICTDPAGRVWAATNKGICYYDFEKNIFHQISYPDSVEPIDKHRVHAVTADHHGQVWFASKTHLHRWKNGMTDLTISLPDTNRLSILYLHADVSDRIWIGIQTGLFMYHVPTGQFYYKRITTPFSMERNLSCTVHPIVSYSLDTLLIGSWYGGVQKVFLDHHQIHAEPFTDEHSRDNRKHIIRGICKASPDQFWIGSYGNGLSLLDSRSGTFSNHQHFDPATDQSLSSDFVNDVYLDNSGILWVGTDAGLDQYDPLSHQFQSISIPQFRGEFSVYRTPTSILKDHRDSHMVWVTISGAGLCRYDKRTMMFDLVRSETTTPNPLPGNQAYVLFRDSQHRNWIGTGRGAFIANDDFSKFSIPPGLDKTNVQGIHEILEESPGIFWFASFSRGVIRYNEHTGEVTLFQHEPGNPNTIPDNRVFCIEKDHQDHIWIGTQNQGLVRLSVSSGTIRHYHHRKDQPTGIPDNGIYDLYVDTLQRLWIATENGFARYNAATDDFKVYTVTDGLCNSDVYSITPDHHGKFWLATNNGLSRFDPDKEIFKNYFIEDGLPANQLPGAAYCDPGGSIYLGTSGNLTMWQPESMRSNMRIPPVLIMGVRVFDQPIPIDRNGTQVAPLSLGYKQNMVTIDFTALGFTNSALQQFAYRLKGFDDQWIHCGNRRTATFTNLDGGEYTFEVKAANNDGIWNETGTSFRLIIRPPYWKTWWFYSLCFIGAASVLYILYRFRIGQLLRLQQIRTRISRDLHDDIGSTLSSIHMVSSMASRKKAADVKENDAFHMISNASHQAMDLMSDIVWSVNPKNDRMDMVLARMRQYASEILEAAQISFTISMDDSSAGLNLPIEKRKDFYLIFKEAINNMAKYSKASQAFITLTYTHRHLTMMIKDNGIGFIPDYTSRGNGLRNMQARAGQLHGQLVIKSEPGQGTEIKVSIPVTP